MNTSLSCLGATTVGTGGDWSPTFRLGTNNVPNFLAVVFEKQEISQYVFTRMQDLASEYSNFCGGNTHGPTQREGGDPLPHPTPSPAFGRARGASAPVLGPKPWYPSTFQPLLRPSGGVRKQMACILSNYSNLSATLV